MSDSYYDCLGVEPDASEAEIEAAYREVVKQIHPDKSDSSDTKDRFMRVQEARAVLMDPIKRAQYDQRRTSNTEKQTQDTNREQDQAHDDRQQSQDQEPQQHRHQQEDWQRQYSDEKRRSKSYQSRTRTSNQADNRNEPDRKRRRNRASARTGYSQHGASAPILMGDNIDRERPPDRTNISENGSVSKRSFGRSCTAPFTHHLANRCSSRNNDRVRIRAQYRCSIVRIFTE
ncbi:DnaJ domain-containing protein [Halocatena marina]|uniref:DnaJ domain-containing protein n=1 Tax=Halocatena marina TaxID=2934937 RepID=A0ABD5YMC1_9EURY